MKPAFIFPTIMIALLVGSSSGYAQSAGKNDSLKISNADSIKNMPGQNNVPATTKQVSSKSKKTAKQKNKPTSDFNPYQPSTPDSKPLPYNSHTDRKQLPVTDSIGAGILRSILINKRH